MGPPRPPKVLLLTALWSPLDGIWGVLKGSWGVLADASVLGELGFCLGFGEFDPEGHDTGVCLCGFPEI